MTDDLPSDNKTLSISLSQSWTNTTIPWTVIDKSSPVMSFAAPWSDDKARYMYGGVGPSAELSTDLWEFTASGSGGGSWALQSPANTDVLIGIIPTSQAGRASCNGTGVYLGGYTYVDIGNALYLFAVPGLLTYDYATRTWANESSLGLNSFGTMLSGAAACVQGFNQKGLFLPLGGEVWNTRSAWPADGSGLLDLGTVQMYDVDTNKWYSQTTTGDTPGQRSDMCVTGALGQNGTYEMSVYDKETFSFILR
jgi:hypothetical protein